MMFEKAARLKLRFPYKGMITAEDLWDLSVEELDSIYRTVNQKAKAAQEDTLLTKKTKEDTIASLQVEIVKHVVEVKLQEANDKELAAEKRAKKQKLMEILAAKQETELQGKSVEELQKMMDEL